jgi:hypothetical protein
MKLLQSNLWQISLNGLESYDGGSYIFDVMMTSTWPFGTLGSVVSLLAATHKTYETTLIINTAYKSIKISTL